MSRNDIDIVLITYNRATQLNQTLKALLAPESPVRDFPITIMDNASTDHTSQVVACQASNKTNIHYIRHKINCGISGNIIKAIEYASRKWLWVICDDDRFDWTNWAEIETALNQDYDIVHTTYSEGFRSTAYEYLINEEAFIPTCIYNTKHITDAVLQNAYAVAYTLLPHHAIGCKVLNESGNIFVPQHRCVLQGKSDKFNFIRMPKKGIFHRLNDYQILSGYIGAYKLIENETLRNKCNEILCLGSDFEESAGIFASTNPRKSLYNVFELLLSIDAKKQRTVVNTLRRLKYKNFKTLMRNCTGYPLLRDIEYAVYFVAYAVHRIKKFGWASIPLLQRFNKNSKNRS